MPVLAFATETPGVSQTNDGDAHVSGELTVSQDRQGHRPDLMRQWRELADSTGISDSANRTSVRVSWQVPSAHPCISRPARVSGTSIIVVVIREPRPSVDLSARALGGLARGAGPEQTHRDAPSPVQLL